MAGRKLGIPHILMALLALTAVISFFTKSHPPQMELVTPRQELPGYLESYPGDTRLADRVSKSYGLALVLVRNQYSQKNAVALASLRAWARQRFQQQPDFLHPLRMESSDNTRQNFIGACVYNLCSPVQYWLEEKMGRFIKGRIAAFHHTDAYASFRNAYFDLFGVDADSAVLLARYQSDKAKEAIDICISALFLILGTVAALIYAGKSTTATRSQAWQKVLAAGWCITAACYLILCWSQNDLAALVSAMVAAGTGLYLMKPFRINIEDNRLNFRFIPIPQNWLALAYWVSYTLIVIQSVTWMRTGALETPDPISLLISSLTGNFLHDAVHAKHTLMQALGVSWLVVGFFVATSSTEDARARQQTKEQLASLQGPI